MSTNSKYEICVLGSASYDQYLIIDEFPQPGETISALESFYKNGGKGANQAVSAARLECKTCFAGQLGVEPKALTQNLKDEMSGSGLSLEYMRQLETAQTGQAIIMLNKDKENSIVIIGGANTAFSNFKELPQNYKEAIENSNLLLLQKEIPIEINVLAAKYAKSLNKITALDCGGRDENIPDELLENLDFISPNETELEKVTGKVTTGQKIQDFLREHLITQYPKLKVLLKLGSSGSRMITKDVDPYVDAVSNLKQDIKTNYKLCDTTGAGDCFTASFFVKYMELQKEIAEKKITLSEEELYRKSMLFANSSAFLCITVMGAMPSMPKRSDVEKFIETYLKDIY